MQEIKNELSQTARASQEKYIYYLLSAAGASIGFSITQMNQLSNSSINFLLFSSLLLFALSFMFGLNVLRLGTQVIFKNIAMLDIKMDTPAALREKVGFDAIVKAEFEKLGKSRGYSSLLQLLYLFSGAAFLVLWQSSKCTDCATTSYLESLFS
jgi:hypothetical protein